MGHLQDRGRSSERVRRKVSPSACRPHAWKPRRASPWAPGAARTETLSAAIGRPLARVVISSVMLRIRLSEGKKKHSVLARLGETGCRVCLTAHQKKVLRMGRTAVWVARMRKMSRASLPVCRVNPAVKRGHDEQRPHDTTSVPTALHGHRSNSSSRSSSWGSAPSAPPHSLSLRAPLTREGPMGVSRQKVTSTRTVFNHVISFGWQEMYSSFKHEQRCNSPYPSRR